MRSKDRLEELRQLAAEQRVYGDTTVLVGGEGDGGGKGDGGGEGDGGALAAEMEALLQEVERAHTWVRGVSCGAQLVRALHRDAAYRTSAQLQQQLDAAVTDSEAAGLKAAGALKQLSERAAQARGSLGRAARLHAAAGRRLLAAALSDHHAALQALRDDQRRLLHKQIKLTNLEITEEECENLLETNNVAMFVNNVRAETAEARRALRDVETRRDELARVEESLRAVRDLFAQLAYHIAAQQEQIDTVEYYALQASERVECGGHELLKGSVTRKRTRKKKISLIICLASGFLLVLLVLIFT